jgi:hypothetical protein
LDAWLEVARNGSHIEAGSSLARDDIDLAFRPVSQLAWAGLVSAVDHLAAFRDVWLKAGNSHPYADLTLLRSALLSSAITVHLLDDTPGVNRKERCRRGALAAVLELTDERNFLQRAVGLPNATDPGSGHAERTSRVDELLASAKEAARKFGATNKELRYGLAATDAVRTAGRVVSRQDSRAQAEELSAGVLTLWSRGSGAAHGRLWPYMYGAEPIDAGIRLSVDNVMAIFSAAMLVIHQGWRLWDLRRTDHLSDIGRSTENEAPSGRERDAFGIVRDSAAGWDSRQEAMSR